MIGHIAKVWAQLKVHIAVGDGVYIFNLSLDGAVVGVAHVHAERNIIFYGDDPALITPRHFHIVFGEPHFGGNIAAGQLGNLRVGDVQGQIAFGFVIDAHRHFALRAHADSNQRSELL